MHGITTIYAFERFFTRPLKTETGIQNDRIQNRPRHTPRALFYDTVNCPSPSKRSPRSLRRLFHSRNIENNILCHTFWTTQLNSCLYIWLWTTHVLYLKGNHFCLAGDKSLGTRA